MVITGTERKIPDVVSVVMFKLVVTVFQSCTPRWQTCIGNTDDTLGFALGALFVKATFDKHSKEIVSHILLFFPTQGRDADVVHPFLLLFCFFPSRLKR